MVSELLKTVIQAGSIIVGWIVVHKLSAARDRDKARREMLARAADALGDELTKLFASAKSYHTTDRNIEMEDSLKMTLQDISARTSLLVDISNEETELSLCKSALLSVKKAITGIHFEDEHDGPLEQGSQQIQLITSEILRAKRYFLQLKHKQFPAK